jgi:hypothetical protein
MCAAAKATWHTHCDLSAADNDATQALAAARAASTSLPTQTVQIGSSNFDTSDALGTGANCIADKQVLVWKSTVTIPFSNVCPYLAQLGVILQAVSFLVAMMIVFRRTA